MPRREKDIRDFKKEVGEKLKYAKNVPGSEDFMKQYKSALFRAIVISPEYKKLKQAYMHLPKEERKQLKHFHEEFLSAKKTNPHLTEEKFRKGFDDFSKD